MPSRIIPDDALHYHQQDESGFCGAACVQMLLHCKAIGLPLIDQALLTLDMEKYSAVFDPAIAWDAEPDAIVGALEANKGAFKGTFEVAQFETEDEVSRCIVEMLDKSMEGGDDKGIPVIVLTFGFRHWILVRGFETDIKPMRDANGNHNGYQIKYLDLYDPLPTLKRQRDWPPPHYDGDICGSYNDPNRMDMNGKVTVSYPDEWATTDDVTTADIIGERKLRRSEYMRRIPPGTGSVWEKYPGSTYIAIVCNPPP